MQKKLQNKKGLTSQHNELGDIRIDIMRNGEVSLVKWRYDCMKEKKKQQTTVKVIKLK